MLEVMRGVLAVVLEEFKVLQSVIVFDFVDMVDDFFGPEGKLDLPRRLRELPPNFTLVLAIF